MKFRYVFLAVIGMTVSQIQAQHGHLDAGATTPTLNAQLIWANGADFIDSSGYVNTLTYTNGGRFAGYYNGNITLTALPATPANNGPVANAAAIGSYLQFKMACLEGPPGGAFGFWDVGSTAPSISLIPGQSSTNLWRLSSGDGSPTSDPYGHIHGRRFSATRPGIYKIGFTAVDTSTNGLEGGPIHRPSDQLPIWFQADVNIQWIKPEPAQDQVRVHFGAPINFNWSLQYTTELKSNATWTTLPAVPGTDYFTDALHRSPPKTNLFYRVIGVPIPP